MQGVGTKALSTGSLNFAGQIMRERGPLALYRGLWLCVLRDIPSVATCFGFFQLTKEFLKEYWGESKLNSFIGGAVGGSLCWCACYPQDIIKTKYQTSNKAAGDIIREIYAERGMAGFWRGFAPCMTRAPIAIACLYWAYDEAKDFLTERLRSNDEISV